MCVMVVYQPKRIKFGIIVRSRAYGQFGCLVSTCQICQTSFLNSHLKRKLFCVQRFLINYKETPCTNTDRIYVNKSLYKIRLIENLII